MTIETFLMLLLAVSVFTGLFTEAVKIVMDGLGEKYCSNVLAGGVAVILSVLVSAAYVVLTETAYNNKMMVYLIALTLLSWLSAMVGYDKVIQAILQIRDKEDTDGTDRERKVKRVGQNDRRQSRRPDRQRSEHAGVVHAHKGLDCAAGKGSGGAGKDRICNGGSVRKRTYWILPKP